MFGKTVVRLAGSLALAGFAAASAAPTWAADDPSTPAAVPAVATTAEASWQRLAFRVALVGAGLGLASGVGFRLAAQGQTNAFNAHRDPKCSLGFPGKGGPACEQIHTRSESYRFWSNVGLASASVLAVGAVALKLLQPAPTTASATTSTRLACAPGLGASFSCQLVF